MTLILRGRENQRCARQSHCLYDMPKTCIKCIKQMNTNSVTYIGAFLCPKFPCTGFEPASLLRTLAALFLLSVYGSHFDSYVRHSAKLLCRCIMAVGLLCNGTKTYISISNGFGILRVMWPWGNPPFRTKC